MASHTANSTESDTRTVVFRIWRGDVNGGQFVVYPVEVTQGMVVLDCVHKIQAEQAQDLACRWNCKAGKCGSCSAEINGKPSLMCMTRMDMMPVGEEIMVEPMQAFPIIRDLVTDVSWNFEVKKKIKPFKQHDRRGGLYCAEVKLSSLGRPVLKQ